MGEVSSPGAAKKGRDDCDSAVGAPGNNRHPAHQVVRQPQHPLRGNSAHLSVALSAHPLCGRRYKVLRQLRTSGPILSFSSFGNLLLVSFLRHNRSYLPGLNYYDNVRISAPVLSLRRGQAQPNQPADVERQPALVPLGQRHRSLDPPQPGWKAADDRPRLRLLASGQWRDAGLAAGLT
jgi:hypothetical protein